MTKFTALLATGRISNLPTVWCNVFVAFLLVQLAPVLWGDFPVSTLSIPLFLSCSLAASSLYVGGCFLGDAVDVEFDQAHKPDRPIPSGVVSRQAIYTAASFLLSLGTVLPFSYLKLSTGVFDAKVLIASCALTAAIVIYSLWHKRSPWIGLPFIGACRFCLVLFGAYTAASTVPSLQALFDAQPKSPYDYSVTTVCGTGCVRPILYLHALAVGLYTVCFASVARSESSPKPITWRKGLMAAMLILPLSSLLLATVPATSTTLQHDSYYFFLQLGTPAIVALAVYWLWMLTAFSKINRNKGQFVSMSLAGFCLLDATFAAYFGWPCLLICLCLFGLSLLLQKWAPAT